MSDARDRALAAARRMMRKAFNFERNACYCCICGWAWRHDEKPKHSPRCALIQFRTADRAAQQKGEG